MEGITRDQFFELLRGGLWGGYAPNAAVFNGSVDWGHLFKVAKEQTVAGIMWDGVLKLPTELYPPKGIKMSWISLVMTIEKMNKHHNSVIVELMNMYKNSGVDVALMKGQSMAANYPNPLHRICGDIDLYVGKDGCDKINHIIKELGIEWSSEGSKHKNFEYKGVEIENHSRFVNEYVPSEYRKMEDALRRWDPNAPESFMIDGVSVNIPAADFNIIYVFSHMFSHFLSSGVGLRQISDWMLMLDKYDMELDGDYSNIVGWQVFGYIAVNYLGLSKDRVPCYNESVGEQAKWCLDLIFADGNFGKNNTEEVFGNRPKNYYGGKLYAFKYRLKRYARISKVIPVTVLLKKMFTMIFGSVRSIIKAKF